MNFNTWLKDERNARGIRQKDLAEMSGVAVNTIHNAETDRCSVSLFVAERLVNALGYDLVMVKRDV